MSRATALAALVSLVALVGCSSDTSSSDAPEDGLARTSTVDLPRSYRFAPEAIEVDTGTTVTWTNNDNFVHNVHLLDGTETTKDLPVGGKASITFKTAGSYKYECSLHPAQMKGTVVVT